MTLRKLTTKLELETSEFVDGVEKSKRKTIELSNQTTQSVEAIKQQYSKFGKVLKVSENALDSQTAAARKQRNEMNRAERQLKNISHEYDYMTRAASASADEQNVLKAQMRLGAGATDEQKEAVAKLVNQYNAAAAKASQVAQAQREKNAADKAALAQTQKIDASIDALAHEYEYLRKMMDATESEQRVLTAQMRLGANATDAQKQRVADLVRANEAYVSSSGKTMGSMRNMRGIAGNLGFQLQDVAVQAQAGTNWLVILGQQGSQALSAFGPYGAIAGAVLAVGAALGTVMAPALFDTKTEAEKTAKAMENLNAVIDTSSESGRDLVDNLGHLVGRFSDLQSSMDKLAIDKQMLANKQKVAELGEEFQKVRKDFTAGFNIDFQSDVNGNLGAAANSTRKFSEEGEALKKSLEALGKEVNEGNIKAAAEAWANFSDNTKMSSKELEEFRSKFVTVLSELSQGQQRLNDLGSKGTEKGGKTDELQDEIDKLTEQANTYKMNREEQTKLAIGYRDLTDAQKASVDAALNLMNWKDEQVEKDEAEKKALADKKKAYEDNEKAIQDLILANQQLAAVNNPDELMKLQLGYSSMTDEQQSRVDKLIAEKNAIQGALDASKALTKQMDEESVARERNNQLGERRVVSLVNELNALNGMPEVEEAWMTSLQTANPELYKQITAIQALIDQKNAKIAVENAEQQAEQQNIAAMQTSFTTLREVAEEGSALQKAAIVGEQAMAAAKVWANAEAAKMQVTAALASVDPTGTATAARVGAIEAQKWASLGAIAANTVAGVFHDGGGIPDDGTYLMQGGEYVESRAERREIDGMLAKVNSGAAGATNNIYINNEIKAIDTSDFDRSIMKSSQTIAAAVRRELNKQGRNL